MDLLLSNFIMIIKQGYRGSKATENGAKFKSLDGRRMYKFPLGGLSLGSLDAGNSAPPRGVWGHAPPKKILKF